MTLNHRLVLFTHALCRLSYPAVGFAMLLRRSGFGTTKPQISASQSSLTLRFRSGEAPLP